MEEADKVSSSAPDEAPLEIAVNEAAAVGHQTQTDAEEEMTEKTRSLQTNEVTSSPQFTEETSSPSPHISEETSSPSPHIAEETSSPSTQISEETSSPSTHISEETSSPSPHISEETSSTQISEETSSTQISEETSSPQISEETSSPSPQSTEVTSSSQPAEVVVTPDAAEEDSVTAAEVNHTSTEAEVTSTSQADPVITEAAVTPETAEESVTPSVTEAVTPEATEVTETSCTEATEARAPPASAARVTPAPEVSSSCAAQTDSDLSSAAREEEEEKHPLTLHPSASHDPDPPAPAVAPELFQTPSDRWDSPSVASQASDLTMDSLGHKDSAGSDPDVLSQSDDDFMFEMKKSPVSPLNDGRSVDVSDSPSPDLVQDAYDGDDGHAQTESREIKPELSLSYASDVNTPSDDRPMSLPDILKSSPMNPEKVDSGSSEGSPEFSPAHRREDNSPKSPFSANNLLEFDSKILLLKEMAEVTEARIAEKAKLEEEPSFAAFDLVKETDVPLKSDGLLKGGVEEISQTSVQTKFECLNFPSGKAEEHWDSESPSADSFSPVLDAQKPSSFTAEQEQRATDEASEPEPSSEEFEFVERPRGAADEFLEMQDMTFMKPPSEELRDEDGSPEPETHSPSSSHPLTQASDRGKAGLESDFQELSPAPVNCPPADKTGAGSQEGEEGSQTAAVLELLLWRDVRSSALVFGSSLFLLLSLTCCSIISVLSYTALALLSLTLSYRIYKGVLQAVQKSDEGHPFKWLLEKDMALSGEAVQRHSEVALSRIDGALKEMRRLFLVEDLIDSLKFAVLLWVFTYVGSWFNGLTLLILGLVGAFSGPIAYEKHQTQIDQQISALNSQMKDVWGK